MLLDVDGVLAPIVQHPDDAHMPETTRRPLIEVAKRYGVVACVSGRRASDARRVVSLGSIAYLGSHGSEILHPGSIAPEMDRELQAWTRRVQNFAREAYSRVAAQAARAPGGQGGDRGAALARRARRGGGRARASARSPRRRRRPASTRTGAARCSRSGRRCGSTRARGSSSLLRDRELEAALYVGDDTTDIDAFRGLGELVELGSLEARAAGRRQLGRRDAVGARGRRPT